MQLLHQGLDGTISVVFLGQIIATHAIVAPGEASICDDHYGGPRPAPTRAPRPKTASEIAFLAMGPVAEAFIKGAIAAGVSTLAAELAELCVMEAAHGRPALVAGIGRAVEFKRFRAHDVRSILAAGPGVARPRGPGDALMLSLPAATTRSLDDYAMGTDAVGTDAMGSQP